MNACIDAMMEVAGIGHVATDLSLLDLSMLVPDTGWLLITGVVAAVFCLVSAWQDARTSDR